MFTALTRNNIIKHDIIVTKNKCIKIIRNVEDTNTSVMINESMELRVDIADRMKNIK